MTMLCPTVFIRQKYFLIFHTICSIIFSLHWFLYSDMGNLGKRCFPISSYHVGINQRSNCRDNTFSERPSGDAFFLCCLFLSMLFREKNKFSDEKNLKERKMKDYLLKPEEVVLFKQQRRRVDKYKHFIERNRRRTNRNRSLSCRQHKNLQRSASVNPRQK